jgi:hypothetical protein
MGEDGWMDLNEFRFYSVEWINLFQDMVQSRAVVITVMNLAEQLPASYESFCTIE